MGIYRWNSDMIYFMDQASKDTEYYKELATHIAPYLTKDSVLCDIGCGLGDLAMELSKLCKKVYAIDISEQAIEDLKRKLNEENISNVEALCTDVFGWRPDEKIDAAVYCMFGTLKEIENIGRHLQVDQQIIVRRMSKQHQFRIKEKREHRHSAQEMLEDLQDTGHQCQYQEMTICLDQPFKSFDEAIRFFELYNRTPEKLSAEEVRSRITEQDDDEYPYVFQSEKKMGIIQFFTDFK